MRTVQMIIEDMHLEAKQYSRQSWQLHTDAMALYQMGAAAVPALMAFVADKSIDPFPRSYGVMALERMGEVGAPALGVLVQMMLDEDKAILNAFGANIGKMGAASHAFIPVLIEALDNPNISIATKVNIMTSLSTTKQDVVVGPILAMMASDEFKHCLIGVFCLETIFNNLDNHFPYFEVHLAVLAQDEDCLPALRNVASRILRKVYEPYM